MVLMLVVMPVAWVLAGMPVMVVVMMVLVWVAAALVLRRLSNLVRLLFVYVDSGFAYTLPVVMMVVVVRMVVMVVVVRMRMITMVSTAVESSRSLLLGSTVGRGLAGGLLILVVLKRVVAALHLSLGRRHAIVVVVLPGAVDYLFHLRDNQIGLRCWQILFLVVDLH